MRLTKNVLLPLPFMGMALSFCQPSGAATLNPGWYVQGGGGANFQTGEDLKTGGSTLDTSYNTGWMASGSGGFAWANGIRLELEFGYRANDLDTIAHVAGSGETQMMTGMFNAIYAFPTTGTLVPYFGVGAGVGHLKLDSVRPLGASSVHGSDTGVAVQGIAGLEYALSNNLGVNLSYRYMYAPSYDFTSASGSGVGTDYKSQALMVSLRWSFGAPKAVMAAGPPSQLVEAAPPPPAPPARQETSPRQYLVFFDFDSSTLTSEAQSIVRTAAQSAKQMAALRIEITGHADRSGPDRYNMGLSQRRAESVRAQLVRDGVPANEIAIYAKGESQPLVPTADGMREPQNRRVQIFFPGPDAPGS